VGFKHLIDLIDPLALVWTYPAAFFRTERVKICVTEPRLLVRRENEPVLASACLGGESVAVPS